MVHPPITSVKTCLLRSGFHFSRSHPPDEQIFERKLNSFIEMLGEESSPWELREQNSRSNRPRLAPERKRRERVALRITLTPTLCRFCRSGAL